MVTWTGSGPYTLEAMPARTTSVRSGARNAIYATVTNLNAEGKVHQGDARTVNLNGKLLRRSPSPS
jgi:hypothetical protein